ncbi:hypothetical protein C3747_26g115 [Trypanosoma cruzi]|uniref:Uncharacterized protein n=1 Tax=Trypanosoma cruzi TaxID=5693 RepID=A0A2V2X600_TRYCR|nr:hypothetical protein C3747_26g115 [Trypanosoma cruzi]
MERCWLTRCHSPSGPSWMWLKRRCGGGKGNRTFCGHARGRVRASQYPSTSVEPQLGALVVLIKLPGVEVSALTSVSPNFLHLTGCAADVEGHHAHLFPACAMPFPTNEGDFADDVLRRPHLIPLTTRCNAGLVLSDESLPSCLEPKRRAHEETCCSRLVDAWPGRSLLATVEHLICLIAAPSTRCTVLVLLSSADKGGLHDGVSLLEGSVRRKNIVFFFLHGGEEYVL